MPGPGSVACPKPEKRRTTKARKARREADVIREVRAACVERDGYCRLSSAPWHVCDGPSEWAHLGDKKRCHTRGMCPEARHDTAWTVMLCRDAHRAYDAHTLYTLSLEATTDWWADGPMEARSGRWRAIV